jgi:hypothetical protein
VLREIKNFRQLPQEPPLRLFIDDFFRLFVWYAPDRSIKGFQLCYQIDWDEKALTWFQDTGFSHDRVDDGEGIPGHYKMTPILLPNGTFDIDHVLALFKKRCKKIDSAVARFVRNKIKKYRPKNSEDY